MRGHAFAAEAAMHVRQINTEIHAAFERLLNLAA